MFDYSFKDDKDLEEFRQQETFIYNKINDKIEPKKQEPKLSIKKVSKPPPIKIAPKISPAHLAITPENKVQDLVKMFD